MDTTKKKIAYKARHITQNQRYAFAASLYGIGIILLLSASGRFSDGFPMPWWQLVVGFACFAGGKLTAKERRG